MSFQYQIQDIEDRAYHSLSLAETFLNFHKEWADDDDSPQIPTAKYWRILAAFLDDWHEAQVPKLFQGTDIEHAVTNLKAQVAVHDAAETPDPPTGFFGAVDGLDQAVRRFYYRIRTPITVDSVQSMKSMEPPALDSQICAMYGWIDEHGNPKTHLVQQEWKNPGSVVGPDWKHPREIDRLEFQAAFDLHKKTWKNTDKIAKTAPPERKPCPETWDELYDLKGLSLDQAARMKLVTVEEAKACLAAVERARQGKGPISNKQTLDDDIRDMDLDALKSSLTAAGVSFKDKTPKSTLARMLQQFRKSEVPA